MSTSKRSRVLLLIPHLGGGGAERIIEVLARSLDRNKFEVHLGLVTPSRFCLSDCAEIDRIYELNASRIRYSSLKLINLIWRLRPDAILSGMAHLSLLVLLLRPALPRKTRVLIRQNGELTATLNAGLRPSLASFLYGFAYRRADLVICQSHSMKQEIRRKLRVRESKLAVLPNPLNSNVIRATAQASDAIPPPRPAPLLIAIGRLVPEKGFDILLESFAGLSQQLPQMRLIIAGSGPCEASLKEQCRQLSIADRVHFSGHVANPSRLFRNASLFVLSSRTEGIPNALLEAAAAGLPIVTTPASEGLVDLVADQGGVWLTSEISAPALQRSLEAAMTTIAAGKRYQHRWIQPFDISRAIPIYEAAIASAIQSTAP